MRVLIDAKFERVDAGEIEGFIAATTITNIYYIVRKAAGQ
jgi:hypothetical protein